MSLYRILKIIFNKRITFLCSAHYYHDDDDAQAYCVYTVIVTKKKKHFWVSFIKILL